MRLSPQPWLDCAENLSRPESLLPVKPTKAMVLAAGFGVRMRPLTETVPKPLLPLMDRHVLDHVLDRLAVAGVSRAVVNVHYLGEQIIDREIPGLVTFGDTTTVSVTEKVTRVWLESEGKVAWESRTSSGGA